MMRPSRKRVLVTGGASGIGLAICKRFATEGARVAVIDNDTEALARLDGESPGLELCLAGDVADAASMRDAFARIDAAWNGLDVVVNNAGISIREPFETLPLENWQRVLAVNLTGVFLVSQAAVRLLRQVGGGVILNIASVSGLVGMPNYLSYNVSKAGVVELTKTLALELAPTIRVVAICPGYVLTPMQQREYSEAEIARCAAQIPAKRLARPEEIAALTVFLSSSEAEFMTGSAVVVDGGETAGGLASG